MTDKNKKQRPDGRPYETGYRKPPAHTRFVKGQSGNPKGRPRKPKPVALQPADMPSYDALAGELYRPVTLRENGEPVTLTALAAIIRSLVMQGIKGKRLAQKFAIELAHKIEEAAAKAEAEHYARLLTRKREGEAQIAEHRARGLPPPVLRPHPVDIEIHPFTFKAYLRGPETPEQAAFYQAHAWFRDAIYRCHVYAEKSGWCPRSIVEGQEVPSLQFLAVLIDSRLPKSFQHGDLGWFELDFLYRRLSVRQLRADMAMADRQWADMEKNLHI